MPQRIKRHEIRCHGIVQGVGFRPYIYRLARTHSLVGSVYNTGGGVCIEIEGEQNSLALFLKNLQKNPPKLSRIDTLTLEEIPLQKNREFTIVHSQSSPNASPNRSTLLSDTALCKECEAELQDPANRRYGYPFINCTACGPRYTIMRQLPFDRERTSMEPFVMCEACKSEYADPTNRRFHEQGISCPICGIELFLDDTPQKSSLIIEKMLHALLSGEIVALKGIGGFHLLCDATNQNAITALRSAKKREAKPFGVMFKNMSEIEKIATPSEAERTMLASPQHPIVLLHVTKEHSLAKNIAPYSANIGAFLPYTPLYKLLLERLESPLVVTSANLSAMPMLTDAESLKELFGGVCGMIVSHNREIVSSVDDSVAMVVEEQNVMLRLARGYAPLSLHRRKKSTKAILALGADQKSSFALAFDAQIVISPYLGDLHSPQTLEHFSATIEHFLEIYKVVPEIIVSDLHREYVSHKWAKEYVKKERGVKLLALQHHYAHALAAMAEHELEGEALAFCFDGSGYGDERENPTLWGGEVLHVTPTSYKRLYHLEQFTLLGAHKAVEEPRRCALGLLFLSFEKEEALKYSAKLGLGFSEDELKTLSTMHEKNLNSPECSSMGRLFDGVYGLASGAKQLRYEGESGDVLESWARDFPSDEAYEYSVQDGVIEIQKMLTAMIREREKKSIAAKFINTIVKIIIEIAQRHDSLPVILSGGVFQNRLLLQKSLQALKKENISYYIQNKTPINDGGIALGQIYYALHSETL